MTGSVYELEACNIKHMDISVKSFRHLSCGHTCSSGIDCVATRVISVVSKCGHICPCSSKIVTGNYEILTELRVIFIYLFKSLFAIWVRVRISLSPYASFSPPLASNKPLSRLPICKDITSTYIYIYNFVYFIWFRCHHIYGCTVRTTYR